MIAGAVMILVGIILSIPLVPGPGFLFVAGGLAILATEFHWARRLIIRLKGLAKRILPDSLADRIHYTDAEKKYMSKPRDKVHAPASD